MILLVEADIALPAQYSTDRIGYGPYFFILEVLINLIYCFTRFA